MGLRVPFNMHGFLGPTNTTGSILHAPPLFSTLLSSPISSSPVLSFLLTSSSSFSFHFPFPFLLPLPLQVASPFYLFSPIFVCIFSHFVSPSPCLPWNGWDQYDYTVGFSPATRRCCDAYVLQCLLFSYVTYAYLCMHFAIYVDLYTSFLCVSCYFC